MMLIILNLNTTNLPTHILTNNKNEYMLYVCYTYYAFLFRWYMQSFRKKDYEFLTEINSTFVYDSSDDDDDDEKRDGSCIHGLLLVSE